MNKHDETVSSLIRQLTNTMSVMQRRIDELEAEVGRLNRVIGQKDMVIADLRGRLSKYEKPGKNSGNSSVPPSQEPIRDQVVRRTRSLRKPSGRKTGGQPGHKGHSMDMSREPDYVTDFRPCVCESCGKSLDGMEGFEHTHSDVVDIVFTTRITRYRSLSVRCTCGHCNTANISDGIPSGISYGPTVRAFVTYLRNVQAIPYRRTAEIMSELFRLNMSEGTIRNIEKGMSEKAGYPYEAIRQQIEESRVVGGDETGAYVNGEHHWFWTFQNQFMTFLFQDRSRGMKAVEARFPNHFPSSVLVSDRHSTYMNLTVQSHQACLAHILRNLEYLNELNDGQDWSRRLQELIRESMAARKSLDAGDLPSMAQSFQSRLEKLLNEDLAHLGKEFESTRNGLRKWASSFFTFLKVDGVPPDNNGSERAIRNVRTKTKISGCFRTEDGANAFAMIRSITDTARKNNQGAFAAIVALGQL